MKGPTSGTQTHMKTSPDCNGVKPCPDCNGDGVVDKDTGDERGAAHCQEHRQAADLSAALGVPQDAEAPAYCNSMNRWGRSRPRGAELSTVTIPPKSLRANFKTREPVKHGGKK